MTFDNFDKGIRFKGSVLNIVKAHLLVIESFLIHKKGKFSFPYRYFMVFYKYK